MYAQKLNNEPNAVHSNTSQAKTGGNTPFFQPKLTVNQPGDAYEKEADAVADQVMRMPSPPLPISGGRSTSGVQRVLFTTITPSEGAVQRSEMEEEEKVQRKEKPAPHFFGNEPIVVQRKCAECEQDEGIQRKEGSGGEAGGKAAPSIVSDVLSSSSGRPMDGDTQQFMESRFGQDFSQVRIHTDSQAAESAQAIQAKAYTSGRDVVFGAGEYQPESESGKRLLAHELVHVGQQGEKKSLPDSEGAVQRSLGGALAGGLIVGTAGAGLGYLGGKGLGGAIGGLFGGEERGEKIGGITGGILGGLVGLTAGLIGGDTETADERPLTDPEEEEAKLVFGSSLKYTDVRVSFNAPIMTIGGYVRTLHNTIYFPSSMAKDAANPDDTDYFFYLIHELTHVWQYQHGVSTVTKLLTALGGESAYEYGEEGKEEEALRQAQSEGKCFNNFNTEQQGDILKDYYVRLTQGDDTSAYDPFVMQVKHGDGCHIRTDRLDDRHIPEDARPPVVA